MRNQVSTEHRDAVVLSADWPRSESSRVDEILASEETVNERKLAMNVYDHPTCWCGGRFKDSVHPAYYQCRNCGTLVVKESRTNDALKDFYSFDGYWHEYVSGFNYPTVEDRDEVLLRERVPAWYDALVKHKPDIQTLLEIGCSEGSFLHYCKEKGIRNVVGIEVDKDTCDFAKKHFGLEHVVAGLFPEVSLPFSKYDAIAGFDVLEHFNDPIAALKAMKELLADDGVLIFQTPSYHGDGESWIHFKPLEHLFLFNRDSIVLLLDRAGFKVDDISGGIINEDMTLVARKKSAVGAPQPHVKSGSSDAESRTVTIAIGLVEHMGDIVACEPVARHLRSENPEAHIVWCVRKEYAELIENNPYIDETLIVDCLTEWILLSEGGVFDRVVDLHIDKRVCPICNVPLQKEDTGFVVNGENYFDVGTLLGAFSKGAGFPALVDQPRVYIPSTVVDRVNQVALPSEFLVVHATSNELVKDWDPVSWQKLVSFLYDETGIPVVEVGSHSAIAGEDNRVTDLCGKLSLLETAEVIRRAALFVGVDSGPAHLANAVGTRGIVLLGHYRNFRHYLPFSGSYADGTNADLVYNDEGPVEGIPVEKVVNVVRTALEKARHRKESKITLHEKGANTALTEISGKRARLIAFYLPQYHPTVDNDRWWGKGFTEWRNVVGAKPLFPGHYQPHMPADLGFYDLRLAETREAQAELAKMYGIEGFCYWHYWFNGKLLLQKPFEDVLALGSPDFPFCLAWANENWTRRWDGQDKEILQEQRYGGKEDDLKHFQWLLRAFKDPRYMKIDGKPIMLIYRPADKPDMAETIARWKSLAAQNGLPGLYLIAMRTTFGGLENPGTLGCDGELVFQPSFGKVIDSLDSAEWIVPKESLLLYDYSMAASVMSSANHDSQSEGLDHFPSVVPSWDNTARRKGLQGFSLMNATPKSYEGWLRAEIEYVSARDPDRRIVFINAWNEWAEGNHLEPDQKFGLEYLEATRRAVYPAPSIQGKTPVRSDKFFDADAEGNAVGEEVSIGRRAFAADRLGESEVWFRRALQHISKAVASYYHASTLLKAENKVTEATNIIKQLTAAKSIKSQIHNDLGILFASKGEPEKAKKQLQLAAFFDESNVTAKRNLAELLLQSGETEEGVRLYKELIPSRSLLRRGDAMVFYDEALKTDGNNVDAAKGIASLLSLTDTENSSEDRLYKRSQELIAAGNIAEASEVLEKVLALQPEHKMALNDSAVLASVMGENEKAIGILNRLIELDPSNLIALKNLGGLCLSVNLIDDALKVYLRALEIAPSETEIIQKVGDICQALNKYDEAVFFYGKVLHVDPDNASAQKGIQSVAVSGAQRKRVSELKKEARGLISKGDYIRGIELLEDVLKLSGERHEVHNDLGVIYRQQGNMLGAVSHLEKALELNPTSVVILRNLLAIHSASGNEERTSELRKRLSLILKEEEIQDASDNETGQLGDEEGFEIVPCHFCGSYDAVPFRKSADIVKCTRCGTVYLRTRMTEQAMRILYQQYADEGSHLSLPRTSEEVKASGLRRNNFMNEVISLTKSRGTLLDVGCAWGAFLDNARLNGFKPRGVEITRRTAEFASDTLGLDVTSGQFLDTTFGQNSVAVVTMIHSLEHLPQPKKSIAKVFEILEPGGLFAGIVPNIESFCSAQLQEDWEWLQPMYHYVHYSPATLRKHLERAGFIVERVSTFAGDYDRQRVEKAIRDTYHLSSDGEVVELLKAIEKKGFGEEIWYFARKPKTVARLARNEQKIDLPIAENQEELVEIEKTSASSANELKKAADRPAGLSGDNAKRKADTLYRDAHVKLSKGQKVQALKLLNEVVSLFPDHADAHNDLAVLYNLEGDVEPAISHLERSLELKPDDDVSTRNLAILYSGSRNYTRALALFQKLLEKNPQNEQILLSIADICVKLNRFSDAKLLFNKVLSFTKDSTLRQRLLSTIVELDRLPIMDGNGREHEEDETPRKDVPRAEIIVPSSNNLVSIVIPVFNKMEFTRNCLESIKEKVSYKNYEVIMVDNASTDGTQSMIGEWSSADDRFKYIRNATNMGFVDACIIGAKTAKGEYVVLLNNDTTVNENWLEALVDFADRTADCGAVGSKLIYPDGRLQEAGGITFSDANGWNYGRGGNPDHPKFNFVREVDYISGASLLIKKTIWEKVGGLDRRYAPAYYEDADLCFAVRKLGYKVYYEPRSSVVHFEGITSGTNLSEGFKKFQVINRPKFIEKWKDELTQQYANDPRNVEKASSRGVSRRALVIDPILPMFDRAAGSLHLFNILKALRSMKIHITFIATNWALFDKYKPILQDMGIETYAGDPDAMYHFGHRVSYPRIDYKALFAERQFDFTIIDFWYQAEYYLPIIRRYSRDTRLIIDTEDVHFVREVREAELKNDQTLKARALEKKKREVAVYKKADDVWVVTEQDRSALQSENIDVPIHIRPVIHDLPIVNTDFAGREGLLFVGNFNHTPNLDAVTFFVEQVFPRVKKSIPGVRLYIVGNDPGNQVAALASSDVVVMGYVPDLSVNYGKCKVTVAPLRYGAGLKGKVVESLSYGVPVVTTSIGAEGTGLRDGSEILVADDPQLMATRIEEAYKSKELWERLSVNGRSAMESRWSFETGRKMIEELLSPDADWNVAPEEKVTSIIMLTYNQLEYTKLTVDSIRRHTRAPYELIVIDNASTDGTVEYLKAQKDIRTVFNKDNLGFPAGCNQGLEIASGNYALLLNNDVIVADDWLEGLIECAESTPSIGIVGSMSNRVSGLQLEANPGYTKVSRVQEYAAKYRRKNRNKWFESPRVAGLCMLIKREVVEKIGGLDTAFGIGNCEDDDYCLRARLAGYKVAIAGDVFIHHFGSKSFGKDGWDKYVEFIKANELVFKNKWGVAPLEWWREGKQIMKTSPIYLPLRADGPNRSESIVDSEGASAVQSTDGVIRNNPGRVEEVARHSSGNPAPTGSENLDDIYQNARSLAMSGKIDESILKFGELLKANPDHAGALNDLGALYFQKGEKEKAIRHFRDSIEAYPLNMEALRNLADIYLDSGRIEDAMKTLKDILSIKSNDQESLQKIGYICALLGKAEDASFFLSTAQRATESTGDMPVDQR
ncbi:MAG: glycoside hydrolase family 99-like domain-containing protein [Bacteroidetes bacterium]|nr:glycoside hydrolase family 99-like domain-containing protein [Bacteroidota bacterium]